LANSLTFRAVIAGLRPRGIDPSFLGRLGLGHAALMPGNVDLHRQLSTRQLTLQCVRQTFVRENCEDQVVRTSPATRRVKVSVTVDPELLHQVDAFIVTHPTLDRSKIFDEALYLWYARQQQEAMEAQYAQEPTTEEAVEIAAWRRIQVAAANRIFRSDRM
jgi:hypothetical protein